VTGFLPLAGAFGAGFLATGFFAATFEGLPLVAATFDDLEFFCVAITTRVLIKWIFRVLRSYRAWI
jgi:hypothetical protein